VGPQTCPPARLRQLPGGAKNAPAQIPADNTQGAGAALMQVDEATVRRIARLARIKVTDAEARALEKELSGILDWVKQLDEVDTKNVAPMTRVTPMTLKQRADVVTDGGIADDIVANAPAREDHFFVVPKVVE
jgi:aspartyl-tRNA(Asn)/glutamyl-tRNA(Gln) amidotransferase subunit C